MELKPLRCLRAGYTALLSVGLGLMSVFSPVTATEDPLEASYAYVWSEEGEDGAFYVTLDFTFTNTGERDFEDLTIRFMHAPGQVLTDLDQTIAVGRLWTAETVSLTAELSFFSPVDADSALILIAEGHEADGSGESVTLLIDQEAAQ